MHKTRLRTPTMSEKYEKSRFVGVQRTEISEKRLSPARENKKTAKIGFPSRGKIRNHQKSAFLHGGKSKFSEKRLSSTGENQKSAKIGYLSRGKTRNRRKPAFPREGKSKNAVGSISYSSERRKTPKVLQNNFRGAVHILHTLFRYLSTWQLLFSLLLLFGDDLVFRGRHTIAGSKAAVESGTGIEA